MLGQLESDRCGGWNVDSNELLQGTVRSTVVTREKRFQTEERRKEEEDARLVVPWELRARLAHACARLLSFASSDLIIVLLILALFINTASVGQKKASGPGGVPARIRKQTEMYGARDPQYEHQCAAAMAGEFGLGARAIALPTYYYGMVVGFTLPYLP